MRHDYLVEADAIAGSVRLARVVNGERRKIANHAAALAADEVHTLDVKAVDGSFGVSLDGKVLLETHDSSIATPGRFGVWSNADSQTSFGDLFITVLD
jgi:hypothetical protein